MTSYSRKIREALGKMLKSAYERITPEDTQEEHTIHAESLLHDAYNANATDIHLDPAIDKLSVRFRVDGVVHDVAILDDEAGQKLINQIKTLARINPIRSINMDEGRFEFAIDDDTLLDLRVTAAPCVSGEKLAMRVLVPHRTRKTIETLGMREDQAQFIQDWMSHSGGMLLATGPTGGGKTTTLYALLHQLRLHDSNVITLEDPVEYQIDGIN